MSELKEHLFVECDECIREYRGPLSNEMRHYYLKSEADKVIAEKDKAIEELRNEADVYKAKYEQEYDIAVHNEKQLSAMRIEIRRHKYKRCLDKAEMCQARYDEEDAMVNGRGASWDYTSEEMKYWERWSKRWLELAEKFKEARR